MRNFWEKANWEIEDPHLSELNAAPFLRPLPTLPKGHGLFVIRGPRQVGKSSWLKAELSVSVKNHGHNLCYFTSCENLRDHLDLNELLKQCLNKKYIYLDEVTFVRDWSKAIKHFMDTTKDKTLVITGSNASDLRRGADRMPGRHKKGGEFTLLPMSFDEFINARISAKWIDKTHNRIEELINFFQVGGFPSAVIEAGPHAKLPTKALQTYARWLIGDATKNGKNETYLKEICSQIFLTTQSPLSLQKLAQRTQMGSHHTALDYINILEDSFALNVTYAIDPNTGAKRLRKDKKFYFRDPLIYSIAKEWSGENPSINKWNEMLAEATACEHLTRHYTRFGYYHSPAGEIDFYNKSKWSLEVKWGRGPHNLSKVYKNINTHWKTIWDIDNFLLEMPPND